MPLFAVLLADWLLAGGSYDRETHVFARPAWRLGPIVAWLAGFALYQWLYPTGPHWWVDVVGQLDPPTGASARPCRASPSRFCFGGLVAVIEQRPAGRTQRA